MIPPGDVPALVARLPQGTSTGSAVGKRWITTRSNFSNGQAVKVVAEERGGADYISLNFYRISSGYRLFPCEMPAGKVIAFLRSYQPDQE